MGWFNLWFGSVHLAEQASPNGRAEPGQHLGRPPPSRSFSLSRTTSPVTPLVPFLVDRNPTATALTPAIAGHPRPCRLARKLHLPLSYWSPLPLGSPEPPHATARNPSSFLGLADGVAPALMHLLLILCLHLLQDTPTPWRLSALSAHPQLTLTHLGFGSLASLLWLPRLGCSSKSTMISYLPSPTTTMTSSPSSISDYYYCPTATSRIGAGW
jgi:hypothetical protein